MSALDVIPLPDPGAAGEMSLFDALARRKTTREISERALPLKQLSNLLWAAWGVNRRRGPFGQPGRTAASASNSQEIELYVLLREGAYAYEAGPHRLVPVAPRDLRASAIVPGQRTGTMLAPVQLVYVVDLRRLTHTHGFEEPGLHDPEIQKSYYFVDTGLIAANAYLFAASEGLAAWFHNCDRSRLARELRLGPEQRVLFAQSFGFAL